MSVFRGLAATTALATGLLSLSACGALTAKSHTATAKTSTAPSGSAGSSGSSGASGGSGSSGSDPSGGTPATGPGAALLAQVLPDPAGTTPWEHNQTGVMDLKAYIDNFYVKDAWTRETGLMKQRGFVRAARHGWINADGSQDDIWLIQFATTAGARSLYLGLTDSWDSTKTTMDFTDAAVHGKGQYTTALDSLGNTSAKIAALNGKLVVYTKVYTAAKPDKAAAIDLMRRQWSHLG
jgi:hypothetical protein